ncbi:MULTISPECIES: hypothetical protein [unclassified Corynebacterium]|uniref:hypothetical protein n=1 Tax=unclassified Corynebacterium TaxID=2624378 RepID=UPI002A91BB12|nr:hypothetical protein [Corynebacterium sp.]MDY5785774.1 hypothetical protein [Corynebacterium sp.]
MINYAVNASAWVVAQAPPQTPVGPEFGKASPIGLLLLVFLAVVVLSLGFAFHRRFSRFNRRRMFAEAHGIDPFDRAAVDKAMEEAGVLDRHRKSVF